MIGESLFGVGRGKPLIHNAWMWLALNWQDELQFALNFRNAFGVVGVLVGDPCRISVGRELRDINGRGWGREEREICGVSNAFGAGPSRVAIKLCQ